MPFVLRGTRGLAGRNLVLGVLVTLATLTFVVSAGAATIGGGGGSATSGFVIGDQNAAIGTSVTFWGSQMVEAELAQRWIGACCVQGLCQRTEWSARLRRHLVDGSGQQLEPACIAAAGTDRSHRLERNHKVWPDDLRRHPWDRPRPAGTRLRSRPGPRRHGHRGRRRVLAARALLHIRSSHKFLIITVDLSEQEPFDERLS